MEALNTLFGNLSSVDAAIAVLGFFIWKIISGETAASKKTATIGVSFLGSVCILLILVRILEILIKAGIIG